MGTYEKSTHGESAPEQTGQPEACRPAFDCFRWRMRRGGRVGFGIFLIVVGLLWFARNAGLFQADYFWPIVLIIFGVWTYAHEIVCGIPVIVAGSLWLGITLKLFQPDYFWPLFVTIIGIWIAAARLVRGRIRT